LSLDAHDTEGVAGITRSLFLRQSAGLAASLSLASVLAACGSSDAGSGRTAGRPPAKPTGTFAFPLDGASTTFDPAYGNLLPDFIVMHTIYDRLVLFNDAYTDLTPSLATSWEQSADAREFTFHLRPNVRFHDGEPLDSTAVKKTFEYFVSATASFAYLLMPPKFAKLDDSDPAVLRVVTSIPQPDFVRNQTFLGVLSPKAVAKGADYIKQNAIGSGAYTFSRRGGTGGVVVEANKDYWGGGPYFERIDFSVISDPGAQINALLAGQANMAYRMPPTQVARVKSAAKIQTVSGPVWSSTFLPIACNVKPFDDVRVRQAVAHAIDKEALIAAVARGQGEVADTFTPKGVVGYAQPSTTYRHDPARARQLLAEAGHTQPVKLRMITHAGAYLQPQLAQAVAGQLNEAGFAAQVDVVDVVAYGRAVGDARQQTYAAFPTEYTWLTGGPLIQELNAVQAVSRYAADDIVKPLDRMRTTPDGPERDAAFKAFEDAFSQQVPMVPLFQSVYTDGLDDTVGGYTRTPKNGYGPNFGPLYAAAR
jgi:peptide/nickel transport system substrate-binding protein